MTEATLEQATRDYFQRVMVDHSTNTDHMYAENQAWQRTYTALRCWIAERGLQQGRLLEVGCGTGLLQDEVADYVGIDLAASSATYLHKPFYVASATNLPFADQSFDGVCSVWVLEHILQPEEMLAEIRRVLKPGGSVFLRAAFAVDSWVSQGLHKRPLHELTPHQRLIRLTIPIRGSGPYKVGVSLRKRLGWLIAYLVRRQPTRLHYRRLQPNYETYWDYDADACVSLDAYDLVLYFLSRGDRPHFPAGLLRSLLQRSQPQAYIRRTDIEQVSVTN